MPVNWPGVQVNYGDRIAGLADAFLGGQKERQGMDLERNRREVLSGIQRGPDGQIDFAQAAERLLQMGDLEGGYRLGQIAQKGGNLTDELKEYQFAVNQGEKRPFTEWKLGLKQAGATRINNSVVTGDNAYAKKLGEADAETFVNLQKGSRAATGTLASLGRMKTLVSDPNFYSGTGAERFALPLKQIVASLGGDPNAAAPMEEFRALSSKAALDGMGGSLGTGFSNADRDFITNQYPNLANTPEGNRARIEGLEKIEKRKQEIARQARDYARRNNGRLDAGFEEELAQWAEQNPIFGGQSVGGPRPPRPSGSQGGAPVQVRTQQERDALPPGTQYVAPDGSIRTKR